MANLTYKGQATYHEEGGDRFVIADGGTLLMVSGGTLEGGA